MVNSKSYYVMLGDEGSAVGLPYYAKVEKSVVVSDGFLPSSIMHRLFGVSSVYLLDTDTGCLLRRPVLACKEGDDYIIQIGGLETNSIVKFPQAKGGGKERWVEWQNCDPMRIDGNLTFFDAASQTGTSIMPFDDKWDLCITQYKYNKIDPVRSFRYYLTLRSEGKRRLIDEDIHLCKYIQCYCTTLAKLQNRAILFKSDVKEYAEIVKVQLIRALGELPDDAIRELPCGIALQSLERFADTLNSINFLYQFSNRLISYINDSYAFCFDVTAENIVDANGQGYPFLYAIIRDEGELSTLLAAVTNKELQLAGGLMNSSNNEIIHF